MDHLDLDILITQITSSNNPLELNNYLRSIPNDTREVVLAGTLSSGQDPLGILDVRVNTLGVLYILSARMIVPGAVPPPWQVVDNFCHNFDINQARCAPERLIALGKSLQRLALHYNNKIASIIPLRALIRRFSPDPSYLTALHPVFLMLCVSNRRFTDALTILQHPITNLDTTDMTYIDNLIFHYLGGITLAALKMWPKAEELFEICVTAPGIVPSAIQLEALKKMRLVQLISRGKTEVLPKYALPSLTRLLKITPYNAFVNAYPHNIDALKEIARKERTLFATEKNLGLINQAIERAPRWALKKLIGTYVTLNLTDIARQVKLQSDDQVREMLLNMIESSEISARISANGTVIFSDPPPTFTRSQVDDLLRSVQNQTALLSKLDSDLGKSREYLAKVVKLKDESWGAAEEILYTGEEAQERTGGWIEDMIYTA